jgi:3',5'-cyclic AMP phosphodiesterase CpdA
MSRRIRSASARRRPGIPGVETKYMKAREEVYRDLGALDRRSFCKVAAATAACVLGQGLLPPQSFLPVRVAFGDEGKGGGFRFAYISDSHLYTKKLNDRFVNSLMRAVDDINRLDPQPDFVLYGGDLAQLGQPAELDLGREILRHVKAPVRMMVGEHDWYLDLGEKWKSLFGAPHYSFDHKGVHIVVLNSVVERDFWTARGLTAMERMQTVAGLDNGKQSPFMVGDEQRAWLAKDLEKVPVATPLIVFSHSPLYKLYRNWNFWTDDAEQVQEILARFERVTVIHGHTHQLLTNRIGNIHFHGMLSTAWPWPYAPEGMPELTIQMARPDPFNPQDGCGDGQVAVHPDGLVDKIYDLWNRNPITVGANYLVSGGKEAVPPRPNRFSY